MTVCAYCGHEEGMHAPGPCAYDGVRALDGRWRHCTCPGFTIGPLHEPPC